LQALTKENNGKKIKFYSFYPLFGTLFHQFFLTLRFDLGNGGFITL